MKVGDIVVRKSYNKDITFKIIDINDSIHGTLYTLKGVNIRVIADSLEDDLEVLETKDRKNYDKVFDNKVNDSIKNILLSRGKKGNIKNYTRGINRNIKNSKDKKDLSFGRPGKILHVDGDPEYLEVCLKVYRQLELDAVGRVISEKEQPDKILEMVRQVKPDIVVITGHDAVAKGNIDYMDVNNYRNSKYFIKAVAELRNYECGYDDLVIFAGACQSHYEAILDAGANFASSPGRVLIHCLDPVFLCEKIAYTNIEKVVSIKDALQNTISGSRGLGGLETRGKYRKGFPKSQYV